MRTFKIGLFVCTILFITFSFKNKVTEDDVHKMLQSSFKMEAKFCGCFGCGTEKAIIYKKDDKRLLKLVYDSSGEIQTRIFEFTSEMEKRLEFLLINRLNNPNQGFCTTSTEYTFKNRGFRFRIFDGSCSLSIFFNDLPSIRINANAN